MTLWPRGDHPDTIFGCIQPLRRGVGDITDPHLDLVEENGQLTLFGSSLALLVGDLLLSSFEDNLSEAWPKCLDRDERSFRVMSAFWRMIQKAVDQHQADLVLIDLGPNLGAINRAALISADFVVVPLSPDLFSLQGLRNLGPTLRNWREGWKDRVERGKIADLPLPPGQMNPAGYVVLQHAVRLDRPVQAYERWIARIPNEYREQVLEEPVETTNTVEDDQYCLALLKHYHSLMPMAQEAHKPIFNLKPADGAIGSHMQGVQKAYKDFQSLALNITQQVDIHIK